MMGDRPVDTYKHLNEDKDFKIELDMVQVADMVCSCNYGFHRFISAVINRYEKSNSNNQRTWAKELRRLIEEENLF